MLEGDLGDFTLPEILQLLAFTTKSGRLQLHGPVTAGCIVLSDGHVTDVSADVARVGVARRLLGLGHLEVAPIEEVLLEADEVIGDRQLLIRLVQRGALDPHVAAEVAWAQAIDQLAELLRWREGSFRFDVDAQTDAGMDLGVAWSTGELVDAAHERLTGWDELVQRVGEPDQVVTLTAPVPPQDVTVPADGWAVLRHVDGHRTIEDLAERTGRGVFDTGRAVLALVEWGLARVGESTDDLERVARIEARHHPGAGVTPGTGRAAAADAGADGLTRTGHDAPPPAPEAPAASEWPATQDTPADDGPDHGPDHGRAPLRARVRPERLRTDPTIDEDLVSQLIDGVKEL